MDELAREVSQKNINWEHVNKLIADMGDSINNLDDHDSMLTYTLKDVKYGQNAAQITKIFIDMDLMLKQTMKSMVRQASISFAGYHNWDHIYLMLLSYC